MAKEARKRRVRERKQKTLYPLMVAEDVVEVYVMVMSFKSKVLISGTITKAITEAIVQAKLVETMIGPNTYRMIE